MKIKNQGIILAVFLVAVCLFCSCAVEVDETPVTPDILANAVVMGEVGLTGEVRTINFLDKRLIEAEKMGFRVAVVPQGNLKAGQKFPIEVKGVRNVGEALRVLLGGA